MDRIINKIKSDRIMRLIVPICLLLMCIVGVTIAFLITNTDDVKNTFTASETGITVVEDFGGTVKEDVKVKNTGDIDVYVRVMLVHNWYRTYDDGSVSSEVIAGKSNWEVTEENKVDGAGAAIFNTDDWFYCKADGYYYCKSKLAPGNKTANLINSIKLLEDDTDGTHQGLEIIAEAIQADGKSLSETTGGADGVAKAPVELAWPNVKVGNDGELTLAKNSGN